MPQRRPGPAPRAPCTPAQAPLPCPAQAPCSLHGHRAGSDSVWVSLCFTKSNCSLLLARRNGPQAPHEASFKGVWAPATSRPVC